MTRPTWKQAITIMKQLQLEYGLPIFAATYVNTCSCCAEVSVYSTGVPSQTSLLSR